jgi:hypothetical protein
MDIDAIYALRAAQHERNTEETNRRTPERRATRGRDSSARGDKHVGLRSA